MTLPKYVWTHTPEPGLTDDVQEYDEDCSTSVLVLVGITVLLSWVTVTGQLGFWGKIIWGNIIDKTYIDGSCEMLIRRSIDKYLADVYFAQQKESVT